MASAAPQSATPAFGPMLNANARRLRDIAKAIAGATIPLAILAAVVINAHGLDVKRILAVAPGMSLFWPTFALLYATLPISYWVIYRRIWRLPVAGLVPLFRKQVANEILVGYSGEAHFYFWARRHGGLSGSPFGAIKDVSLLSAVSGNIATLVLMVVAAADVALLMKGPLATTMLWSVAAVVVFSLLPVLFRHRLFSLPSRELRFILVVHLARIAVWMFLTAATWHFLLPDVALGTWLSLVTLRMIISRLPLVANKDVLFAAATIMLFGKDAEVAVAITFIASLTLLVHLAVGAIGGIAALGEKSSAA